MSFWRLPTYPTCAVKLCGSTFCTDTLNVEMTPRVYLPTSFVVIVGACRNLHHRRQVEDRQQRVTVAEAADRREVVAADRRVVDLHVHREVAHAAADHVVVLRIARVAGAEDERVGRAIRDAEARREEILLHLDAAIDRDVAEAAEQQPVAA